MHVAVRPFFAIMFIVMGFVRHCPTTDNALIIIPLLFADHTDTKHCRHVAVTLFPGLFCVDLLLRFFLGPHLSNPLKPLEQNTLSPHKNRKYESQRVRQDVFDSSKELSSRSLDDGTVRLRGMATELMGTILIRASVPPRKM